MRRKRLLSAPKKQRKHYSGKKKRRAVKTQVVVRKSDGLIVCLAFAFGRTHDFRLFKESLARFLTGAKLLLNSACQGMGRLRGNCELPKKRTKKNPLGAEDKRGNHELSRAPHFPRALILPISSRIAAARSNPSFFAQSNTPFSRPLTSFARRPETTRSRPARSVNPASGQDESRSRGSSRTSRAGTETRNGLAPLGSSSSRREARGWTPMARPSGRLPPRSGICQTGPRPIPMRSRSCRKDQARSAFSFPPGARPSRHTTRLRQRRRSPNTRSLRASRSLRAPRTPTPPPSAAGTRSRRDPISRRRRFPHTQAQALRAGCARWRTLSRRAREAPIKSNGDLGLIPKQRLPAYCLRDCSKSPGHVRLKPQGRQACGHSATITKAT